MEDIGKSLSTEERAVLIELLKRLGKRADELMPRTSGPGAAAAGDLKSLRQALSSNTTHGRFSDRYLESGKMFRRHGILPKRRLFLFFVLQNVLEPASL
jgi:hypothetical protein